MFVNGGLSHDVPNNRVFGFKLPGSSYKQISKGGMGFSMHLHCYALHQHNTNTTGTTTGTTTFRCRRPPKNIPPCTPQERTTNSY